MTRRGGFVTLPARMHEVQTWRWVGAPFTSVRTRWMFGSQRRLVRRCEWETFIPKLGLLPQISHTAATLTRTSKQFQPGDTGDVSIQRNGAERVRPSTDGAAAPAQPPVTPGGRVSEIPSGLTAEHLVRAMRAFSEALDQHRDVVNRLNVYPVPDGDTGTNMSLTLESVVSALAAVCGADDSLDASSPEGMVAVCKAISHGSLMGARGNSGVILCQILRGIAGTFSGCETVGPHEAALALAEASAAARAGVMRPVEGTILTVCADAAAAAQVVDESGEPHLLEVFEAAREASVESLWRTPELLPVLAQAGVVDAGGAGLVLLYDAFLHALDGRPLPGSIPLPPYVLSAIEAGVLIESAHGGPRSGHLEPGARGGPGEAAGIADLRYEVMYFLEAPDEAIGAFKDVWAGIGDSIVVVGGEGLWNCHIHTDDIGASIDAALDAGRPRDIRVTDLLEQVEEESWVRRAEEEGVSESIVAEGPPPVTSVVAVATGDGIRRIFHSLGVNHIVAGGQSMNPSTAQILEIVELTPGSEVVILPNNKNILAVAKQACELSKKRAVVIDTAGIQEGFAALLEYDPEATADENAVAMGAAASRVLAGEVTRAVRATEVPAGRIETGDWIGLSRSGIESVGSSLSEATCELLAKLLVDTHEIVTLIEGAGATAAETRRVTEWLREHRPDVSLELHHGGQPLYPYLVSVE
jgi:DAK2 domain fusion protein YloV